MASISSDSSALQPKLNLFGCDLLQLKSFCLAIGESSFRAQQIFQWVHKFGITDPGLMHNLSKNLRFKLSSLIELNQPVVAYSHIATDGTRKWLFKLTDGNCIETVFIPEKSRGTVCISSQVGCILNCDFCATGKQGFSRNLTSAEIVMQLWFVVRELSQANGSHDYAVTNVVMMGMGEPLLNFTNLLPALRVMLDQNAYGLAKRRVTVSTAGVVPAMYDLWQHIDVALAVSLHAANDELRNKLVPINKKYPLAQLIAACHDYCARYAKRKVTMEYVMLDHINDSAADAQQLIKLLKNLPVKINLIPFNPFRFTQYRCSPLERIWAFQQILLNAGIYTTIRKTRGQDIAAACGQLVGQVADRTKRQERYIQQNLMSVHNS